jgi:hypothetical protein
MAPLASSREVMLALNHLKVRFDTPSGRGPFDVLIFASKTTVALPVAVAVKQMIKPRRARSEGSDKRVFPDGRPWVI